MRLVEATLMQRRAFAGKGLLAAGALNSYLQLRALAHNGPRTSAVEGGHWPDEGGATIQERMAHHDVPGVSLAVIHEGALKRAKGYGEAQAAGPPIRSRTRHC